MPHILAVESFEDGTDNRVAGGFSPPACIILSPVDMVPASDVFSMPEFFEVLSNRSICVVDKSGWQRLTPQGEFIEINPMRTVM